MEETGLMALDKLNNLLCIYAASYFVLGMVIVSLIDMII